MSNDVIRKLEQEVEKLDELNSSIYILLSTSLNDYQKDVEDQEELKLEDFDPVQVYGDMERVKESIKQGCGIVETLANILDLLRELREILHEY